MDLGLRLASEQADSPRQMPFDNREWIQTGPGASRVLHLCVV
jgi:hypothetical protein